MKRDVRKRLVTEAQACFVPFGIDFSLYRSPVVGMYLDVKAQVHWVNKKSGELLVLTDVYFNHDTGEILQYGSQSGQLTL